MDGIWGAVVGLLVISLTGLSYSWYRMGRLEGFMRELEHEVTALLKEVRELETREGK